MADVVGTKSFEKKRKGSSTIYLMQLSIGILRLVIRKEIM